ncbi:MAG: ThiF family adenylyltransferase [Phycisphaerae bacterium]|nr:ThiF family adenylyltransferase [Phycisphaerae bacterium]
MDYQQVYQRNIGIFTPDQQDALRAAKVTVAGVGGVGGIEAVTLARFGIGELSIMDPGLFDEPDMNRQYGAMQSTIGQNKAAATARILRDVNPFMKLNVLETAPTGRAELEAFMRGSDLVIDAIDYVGFDYKAMFAEIARDLGVLNLTAPIPGFGAIMMIFAPDRMTMEEFYDAPADRAEWAKHRPPLEKLLGPGRTPRGLTEFLEGRRAYLPTVAGAAALNGGVLATEIALILTGLRKPDDVVTAPRVTYVDMLQRVYEVYDASDI